LVAVPNSESMAPQELELRGNKVIINSFTASDINVSYISWLNDPVVVRFSNQRFIVHDEKSCLRYLASFNNSVNLFMGIRRLSDGHLVGTMTAYVSSHHDTVDVGIMIGDKSVWGSGYGQDAWETLTDWLLKRDDIRKLTAGTLACNYGMIKLMERSGMHHEATRKEQEIVNKQAVDVLYFAKFCEE
jgi:[ribosomal protein S5]-alanine N-acetyltransferase